MRLLILGAGGFIGSHLAKFASSQGHEVIALCRSGVVPGWSGPSIKWAFGQQLPSKCLENISCAIHLAHDFDGKAGAHLTIDSMQRIIPQLREAGVLLQIYFSSYSAGEHAKSLYGRTKLTIEQANKGSSDVVIVRPGLVLGDGGIYARICKWARKLPLIPLPDGGYGQIPVITIERLCRETIAIAAEPSPLREANLFERNLRSLRELVLEAASESNNKPWLVSVPSHLIILGLRFAEFLRLPIPVNADNLSGFIANQSAHHISSLQDPF